MNTRTLERAIALVEKHYRGVTLGKKVVTITEESDNHIKVISASITPETSTSYDFRSLRHHNSYCHYKNFSDVVVWEYVGERSDILVIVPHQDEYHAFLFQSSGEMVGVHDRAFFLGIIKEGSLWNRL